MYRDVVGQIFGYKVAVLFLLCKLWTHLIFPFAANAVSNRSAGNGAIRPSDQATEVVLFRF
jgi:hypothetical protein